MEGHQDTHGKALGPKAVAEVRDHLGWPHEPFVVPERVTTSGGRSGGGGGPRQAWESRLRSPRRDFDRRSGELRRWPRALARRPEDAASERPRHAGAFRQGARPWFHSRG
jgi:transketolase